MSNVWRKSRRRAAKVALVAIGIAALPVAFASPASASIGVCESGFHISGTLSPNSSGIQFATYTFPGYSPTVVAGVYNSDANYVVWPSFVEQSNNVVEVGFKYSNPGSVSTPYSGFTAIDYQC